MAEIRDHQVIAPVHAAVLEEAVVQGDGVGGEDADLLALLQQGADPRQEAVQQQEVPPREAAQLTEMHLQQLRRTSRIRMERLLP